MGFNKKLAERTRECLVGIPNVEEKEKMGGLTFMVNDKVCVRLKGDEMLFRIDPDIYESSLKKKGSYEWIYKGKPMKGWVIVRGEGLKSKKDLDDWITLCLDFNKKLKTTSKN